MQSFISDSESSDELDLTNLPPLHQEILDELKNGELLVESSTNPGFVEATPNISTDQPLFTIIDSYRRQYDTYYPEVIVRLWQGPGQIERFIHLRGSWLSSQFSIGDTCFIIGSWERRNDSDGIYYDKLVSFIDDANGFIVILPQVLISGTEMSNAYLCKRMTYIKSLCPEETSNVNMFRGVILHLLLQKVFMGLKEEEVDQTLDNLLDTNKQDIFLMNESIESSKESIKPYLAAIKEIARTIQNKSVPPNSVDYNVSTGITAPIEYLPPYGANTVHEEENLWSFQWGLKGKIDATMEQDDTVFPFELKSGSSYRGQAKEDNTLQLSSYIFMMKERYREKAAPAGVLFYLKDKTSFLIRPRQNELMNILMLRNTIAHSISHGSVPETSGKTSTCKYCKQAQVCAFLDDGSSDNKSSFHANLCYQPTQTHIEFYNSWDAKLVEEMIESRNLQSSIWTMPVKRRVSLGRAINGLRTLNGNSQIIQFIAEKSDSITKSTIAISNIVLFTRHGTPPIVGRGTVVGIEDRTISVEVIESTLEEQEEDICIDIWDSYSTVSKCRKNLAEMMTGESESARRLRGFVVENNAPVFGPLPATIPVDSSTLNEDQVHAIKTALAAQDYMLLLGMPGTGKTTTLAHLIESFEKKNLSVLICSFTHAAVDNLCMKLIERNINFLRIGKKESINPNVWNYAIDPVLENCENIEQMRLAVQGVTVFASTCYACNNPFIASHQFDVCVIDEASQISMPVVIGPLLRCKKYILVGDHYQLPPIIKSHSSSELPTSLFRQLCENHPHALVTLRTQYRMNNEIMRLCNELVYSQRMRTGNALEANKTIFFPNSKILDEFHPFHKEWIEKVLHTTPSVIMLDTDGVPMLEQKGSGSKLNVGEAAVVSMIAVSMILAGLSIDSIGIISPYRAQVLFIRKALQAEMVQAAKHFPALSGNPVEIAKSIEVDTVDKYQGRDKDCIIISTVKSNAKKSPGLHATDWQRLNVAITRAKTKLIFVGSRTTLINSPFFEQLFLLLDEDSVQLVPACANEGSSKPFISIPTTDSLSSIETQDY